MFYVYFFIPHIHTIEALTARYCRDVAVNSEALAGRTRPSSKGLHPTARDIA